MFIYIYWLVEAKQILEEDIIAIEAPTIQHSPIEESFFTGDNYGLTVTAQDQDGVYEVILHYRKVGEPYFDSLALLETSPGNTTALCFIEWTSSLFARAGTGVLFFGC